MKFGKILIAALMLFCLLAACTPALPDETPLRVYVLTGPTGIGASALWASTETDGNPEHLMFSAAVSPDEIVAKLSSGEADIAAISTNLAAKLYQKTNGGIRILAVNTGGVLSILENGTPAVHSMKDLAGRKIVTTGQGANPQYILEYLLRQNGLEPGKDVTVEYKAEGSELVTVWATEPDVVLMAPSPVAESILMKYPQSVRALDVTEEWNQVSPDSALMMGCLVVRTEYLEAHSAKVRAFLEKYESSLRTVQENPAQAGIWCETYGLIAKAALAEKAIPHCHLCYITGEEMKAGLSGYLRVLYEADPASIGELPPEGFWVLNP